MQLAFNLLQDDNQWPQDIVKLQTACHDVGGETSTSTYKGRIKEAL